MDDLTIGDSKSDLSIHAQAKKRDGSGPRHVYDISISGEGWNPAMLLRMILAGIVCYGELEQIGESSVAFAFGRRINALMRVTQPYSRNISSVETMVAA